ncbi:MAG: KpsF/GutQ family sugar-phosphate isomerase [Henriciella sp.]|nr:KpsF/GutQ family sugar-phosphate isomerase [Henriciella sp.]
MTDKEAVLDAGRRVIEIERDALSQLEASLGEAFIAAVEACSRASGRIVLAGVGKSGHVARKIAATMASTGTPSLYIHPTEASHGDLGMIASADVVIALSRSGETKELSDLIEYTRRFAIPLIAMTAVEGSTLGSAADICLTIPDAPEACGETRAPTTSTTLSMALGDALAVAVLEQRGFTAEDFKIFHPGGKLGAMLRTVGDLMSVGTKLPRVTVGTRMGDALSAMSNGGLGFIVVVSANDQTVAGMVTDGDIRRLMARGEIAEIVDTAMTRDPITVEPGTLASEALALMNERRITQLIVVEGQTPVGALHMHDLLKAGVM